MVATPIGDNDDLSLRAREVMASVQLVAAEDTRVTRRLYGAVGIDVPQIWSCHDHNEVQRASAIVERLQQGQDVALMSDAGTPLVSDPGFRVVRAAIQAGIQIVPIPGPSAPLCALITSGMATDRFLFAGFPPRQGGKRRNFLETFGSLQATLVFFEAPHRILDTLQDVVATLGDRQVCLNISLTKVWERAYRGTASQVLQALRADPDDVIGEMTLVIEGAGEVEEDPRIWDLVDALAQAGVSPSVIRDAVSKAMGVKRRPVYQRALAAVSHEE